MVLPVPEGPHSISTSPTPYEIASSKLVDWRYLLRITGIGIGIGISVYRYLKAQ
jgi:hypothetical protein